MLSTYKKIKKNACKGLTSLEKYGTIISTTKGKTRMFFESEVKKMKDNKGYLVLTYYIKGKNNNWYCDYYYYDGNRYERGTTRATGWGYDKQSTCVSNAINKYSKNWKRYTKKAKNYTSYGLYDDNTISYGIGISAVLRCIKCFKNVKIIDKYDGLYESMIKLEIREDDKTIC